MNQSNSNRLKLVELWSAQATPWTAKAKPLAPGERSRRETADIHAATVKSALGLEPIGEKR